MLPAARRLLLPAVFTVLTATACGSRSELLLDADEGAAGRAQSPTGTTSGCAALADAYCERLEGCDVVRYRHGTARGSYSFRDEAQCRERFTLACNELIPLEGANGIDGQAATCASNLTKMACASLPQLPVNRWLDVCGFGGGSRPDGYGCLRDLQCASGRCGGSDGLCGFCAFTVADGAACGLDMGSSCRAGSICLQGTCRRLPGSGQPCGPQATCALGFACEDGICRSPFAREPSCNATSCGTDGAPNCDGRGGCVASAVAAPLGACGNLDGPSTKAPTVCPKEQACVSQNDFGSGRCLPLAREGEACDRFGGPACLFPATCGATTCLLASQCGL